mgnify:CR=1 FL=1
MCVCMCMFLQQVISYYCSWSDNNEHLFMIGLLRYPMPHKIGSAFLWAFHLLAMFEVLLGIDTVTQTLRQVNMSRSCKLLHNRLPATTAITTSIPTPTPKSPPTPPTIRLAFQFELHRHMDTTFSGVDCFPAAAEMIKAAVLDKWPGGITTLLAVLGISFGDAMFVIVGEFNFTLQGTTSVCGSAMGQPVRSREGIRSNGLRAVR